MSQGFLSLFRGPVARFVGPVAAVILFGGCTPKYYKRSADKEVYRIIQKIDKRVLGHTNEFTIDTPYSQRDPRSISPAEIIESRAATNVRVLNLDQALDVAVTNSRTYQTQKETLYLAALSLSGDLYEFSPHFFATSTAQLVGGRDEPDVGTVTSQIGVSQLLRTGGRLSLALANDLARYFTGKPAMVSRDSAINVLSVNLTQPLLRGFGKNNPLVENLTQSERNAVYAVRSFSLFQQRFAIGIVTAYFNLLTSKDIVRNNYRNYTNRVETTKYLEARAVDRERQSSVDDARNAELGAKRDYLDSLASYLTSLNNFKLLLGLPISEALYLDDKDLEELIRAGVTPVDMGVEAAFGICVQRQMEVLNAIDQFEDARRRVRVAADLLRTQLDIFTTTTLPSEAPYDYVNFDPTKVTYTAGLRLNLPVDRLLERNNYRATLIAFESQLRSLSLTLDTYRDLIARDLRTLEQTRLNHLNALESLRVAERRVENNVMLLEAGRATIRDVREAQDGLIQAQNNLANSYTDYLSARLALLLNMGVVDSGPDKFWLADPLRGRLPPKERGIPPLRMPDDQVLPPQTFIDPDT